MWRPSGTMLLWTVKQSHMLSVSCRCVGVSEGHQGPLKAALDSAEISQPLSASCCLLKSFSLLWDVDVTSSTAGLHSWILWLLFEALWTSRDSSCSAPLLIGSLCLFSTREESQSSVSFLWSGEIRSPHRGTRGPWLCREPAAAVIGGAEEADPGAAQVSEGPSDVCCLQTFRPGIYSPTAPDAREALGLAALSHTLSQSESCWLRQWGVWCCCRGTKVRCEAGGGRGVVVVGVGG